MADRAGTGLPALSPVFSPLHDPAFRLLLRLVDMCLSRLGFEGQEVE